MSEPAIAVKIVHGRFVSCFPMPTPRPDEVTFSQQLSHPFVPHRFVGAEADPWSDLRRKRMEEAA